MYVRRTTYNSYIKYITYVSRNITHARRIYFDAWKVTSVLGYNYMGGVEIDRKKKRGNGNSYVLSVIVFETRHNSHQNVDFFPLK